MILLTMVDVVDLRVKQAPEDCGRSVFLPAWKGLIELLCFIII
jgi:hypothetical protein